VNFGNVPLAAPTTTTGTTAATGDDKKAGATSSSTGAEQLTFPNGKSSLKFEDFFDIVK
jgi:hypothetical protein